MAKRIAFIARTSSQLPAGPRRIGITQDRIDRMRRVAIAGQNLLRHVHLIQEEEADSIPMNQDGAGIETRFPLIQPAQCSVIGWSEHIKA
jgi:hypothetical protein